MFNKHIIAWIAGQYSIFVAAVLKPDTDPSTTSVSTPPAIRADTISGPATYTANPSIGGGGSIFQDSAHFRVYNAASNDSTVALKHFEAAHACFVETLGWSSPSSIGTTNANDAWYKTNVYSRNASEIPFANSRGQFSVDKETGLVWLNILNTVLKIPEVTVHEYGHGLTVAEKNWNEQNNTGAWWETLGNYFADTYVATPVCGAAKAARDLPTALSKSFFYPPTVVQKSYKVIVDGTPGSDNMYEAWPFLAYLDNNPDKYERLGDQTVLNLVRKYTVGSNDTPLETLASILRGTDLTVQKIVGRYWARLAYVDFGHPQAHKDFLSYQPSLIYNSIDANGSVKSDLAPRYMGANIIPLMVQDTTVSATILSDGAYTATLVVNSSDIYRYVDMVGGKGSVNLVEGDEVSLVVAHTPELVQYDAAKIPAELNVGLEYTVRLTGASIA